MADSVFPGALDDFINPNASDELDEVDHALQHRKANDALAALEAKVGEDGSDDHDSHDWKLVSIFLSISSIESALAGKAPLVHTHVAADVTDFTTAADARIAAARGAADGVAPLSSGLIPSQYLPGFVDDVVEYSNVAAFPVTGETGKIYVALDTGKTWRWSGSIYAEVSPSEVNSVNGYTGIIDLDSDDVDEGSTNQYHTPARVIAVMQPTVDLLMQLSAI